jgi:hypothetical protein
MRIALTPSPLPPDLGVKEYTAATSFFGDVGKDGGDVGSDDTDGSTGAIKDCSTMSL